MAELGPEVVVGAARRTFVQWVAATVHQMTRGSLGGVGDCAVVVGQRGVGKTFLLRRLLSAVHVLAPRTITMFMRYKTAAVHTTPLELLGDKVPAWRGLGTVARLHGTLEKHDVQLVLVVDELDTVFLGSDPNDKEIIAQLLQIAELDVPRRRIVVIVTGSSACLRRLCFQAATDSDRSLYRAYVGKSFNDRKYVAFTVGLPQDATEVAAAMRSLQAPLPAGGSDSGVAEAEDDDAESVAEDGMTNDATTRLLLRTRGVMQCVADALAGRQDVQQRQLLSFVNKRGNKRLQSIWSVLMRYLQAEHNVALIHALQTSAIMDLPEVALSDLQALDPTLTREVLYEWADNGFISFGPRPAALAAAHDSSHAHATPRVHALAAAESACLVNPAGTVLHEQLLAEAIAAKFTLTPATAAKYITDGYVLCRDLQFIRRFAIEIDSGDP